jgi:hypothetical protein
MGRPADNRTGDTASRETHNCRRTQLYARVGMFFLQVLRKNQMHEPDTNDWIRLDRT